MRHPLVISAKREACSDFGLPVFSDAAAERETCFGFERFALLNDTFNSFGRISTACCGSAGIRSRNM
ncbi:hypothetical protein HMPREF0043_02308 [Actinobaculum sp. oral taxon 183 str. F0552]|nr:hypothetical protein HMPREF0043_02308 [Actinobaculum sp. oral taxon 183 str. F0552]